MTPLFVSRYTDGVKTMEIRADRWSTTPGLADICLHQADAANEIAS